MRIICPTYDYNEALSALSPTTLNERRVHLCQVYVARLQNQNHPLYFILPKLEEVQHDIIWSQEQATAYAQFVRPNALKILSLLSIKCR